MLSAILCVILFILMLSISFWIGQYTGYRQCERDNNLPSYDHTKDDYL